MGRSTVKVAPVSSPALSARTRPRWSLDDVPDDGEAETEAGFRPRAARVGLTEPLEHVGQELAADAFARIADGEARTITCHGELDPSRGRRSG